LGNLSTPESIQKLQKALHAKAKAEAGYRFYALYDKIFREDILAHAYAQCRSNRGVPGVDGQDFAEVEDYGLKQWLGELALALKEETYRPAPTSKTFSSELHIAGFKRGTREPKARSQLPSWFLFLLRRRHNPAVIGEPHAGRLEGRLDRAFRDFVRFVLSVFETNDRVRVDASLPRQLFDVPSDRRPRHPALCC
jgi:hypothetical protein